MPAGHDRWLVLREEATYGVYDTEGTDILIRIDDPQFALDPTPAVHVIRTADARNEPILELSGRKLISGDLACFAYADGTAPDDWIGTILRWAQDISSGDLPSFSATEWDGVRLRRTLGCKFGMLGLACAAETMEGGLRVKARIVGHRTDADPTGLTAPDVSAYPRRIYRHIESKGGLVFRTAGSSVRTKYRSFELSIENDISVNFDEDVFATDILYEGRQITGSFSVRFESKDDRDNFESRADHVCSIRFDKTSTTPKHRLELDFQGRTKIEGLDRDRPLGGRQYEMVRFRAYLDEATGTSLAVTTSNPA